MVQILLLADASWLDARDCGSEEALSMGTCHADVR